MTHGTIQWRESATTSRSSSRKSSTKRYPAKAETRITDGRTQSDISTPSGVRLILLWFMGSIENPACKTAQLLRYAVECSISCFQNVFLILRVKPASVQLALELRELFSEVR